MQKEKSKRDNFSILEIKIGGGFGFKISDRSYQYTAWCLCHLHNYEHY